MATPARSEGGARIGTELVSAAERAVLGRVRSRLPKLGPDDAVIGIRSPGPPVWQGLAEVELDGWAVRVVACPSVLAVLDALSTRRAGEVLVLLTDQPENELGDAVLARLHRATLYDVDRYTLLDDLLGVRLDPRIRTDAWLVDALIELTAELLPRTVRTTLSLPRVLTLVLTARIGVDPEQVDLPELVGTFDDVGVRSRWRALDMSEQAGLTKHLVSVHGGAAAVVAALALHRDDVLADLLVAQAVVAASESDRAAAVAYGRFTESRFPAARSVGEARIDAAGPNRDDLAAAAAAAVGHVSSTRSARVDQQIRRADAMLEQLHAAELAVHSTVLPRGYTERVVRAAENLTAATLAEVAGHRDVATQGHRYQRLLAALRLRRWIGTEPPTGMDTAADGLPRHARELAWVDRALAQVRAGDAEPRVQKVLASVAAEAGGVRTLLDTSFAARLAVAPETPARQLAVETLLPSLVAPLAQRERVLLVVVDGMSGAVAGDLAEDLTDHRSGWVEVVRSTQGAREAVLAAFPTETTYCRTSLFRAALGAGTAADERTAFIGHTFWPPGGAVLVHKAGVGGSCGNDLGTELDQALGPVGPPVVAVVLNAVDDSLSGGRQSLDPAWHPGDVGGLLPLLGRAAESGRVVVLTSDHGHVLEHGSALRSDRTGGARWRAADAVPASDEVLLVGPRVLTPDGRAVLAATEELRYGGRAHGYHGGATLAEVAIPLIVLLPPGTEIPDGFRRNTDGAPGWWDGVDAASVPVAPPTPTRRPSGRKNQAAAPQGDALFEASAPGSGGSPSSGRGARLVASAGFRAVHAGLPANRVPDPVVVAAVVDALDAAGGRLPAAAVLVAAGSEGRSPRGVVAALIRVLNRDSYPVLTLVDGDRAVALNRQLLDEQFPDGT